MGGHELFDWFTSMAVQSFWWTIGIFFIAALTEMLFPPFPGDAVFFLGLVSLEAGGVSVIGAFAAAALGGMAGFVALYWLGRWQGRELFIRRNRGVLSVRHLERVEAWFKRWGAAVIIFGRFLAGVRSAVPLAAGVGDYPLVSTVSYGAVSILVWNGLLASLALLAHAKWDFLSSVFRAYSVVAWVVLVALAAGLFFWFRARKRT
jgi:membrane protein DedA with SNARE-associated domain